MKNRSLAVGLAILASATLGALPAHAGPAGDALARCIDTSLTKPDKTLLARWMYSAMSAYPDAQKLAPNATGPMESLNRSVAALFKKLVSQTCNDKTAMAMQTDGKGAIEDAFKLLPQVGVRELITDPAVAKQLAGLQKFMEEK